VPTLRNEEPVFVLDLGDDENRFHPDWLRTVNALLDTVLASPGPAALVTTGSGKFYSNGIDLDWLATHGDQAERYVADLHALLARLVAFPVPTVAAINGHAFGGGALLALAHDFRVMRADRGYFCFPEADINIPFTPGMAALVQSKLTPAAAMASMTTGRRFGGAAARETGLVDLAAAESEVLGLARERAGSLAALGPIVPAPEPTTASD